MMKMTLAGAALVGASLLAGPVAADTPGCVTHREYRAVTIGMLQPRVHRIFDTTGKSIGGGRNYRKYPACGSGTVYVDYYQPHPNAHPDRWKVQAKRQDAW